MTSACKLYPPSPHFAYLSLLASDNAVGLGPERSAIRLMVGKLTSDQSFWRQNGDHVEPVFQTKPRYLTPERLAQWSVCGAVCAIHVLQLRAAPYPISPWLLLAAVLGEEGFNFTQPEVGKLDPGRARMLKGWFELTKDDAFPSSPLDPLRQLFVAVGEDVCVFFLLDVHHG